MSKQTQHTALSTFLVFSVILLTGCSNIIRSGLMRMVGHVRQKSGYSRSYPDRAREIATGIAGLF